jgi:hypothetical protein
MMPGKVDVSVDKQMNLKEKRKIVPLLQKVDVMDKMDYGFRRTKNLNLQTNKRFVSPENETCRRKPYFNLSSKQVSCFNCREPFLANIKLVLCVWPDSKTQSMSLCGEVVRKKGHVRACAGKEYSIQVSFFP